MYKFFQVFNKKIHSPFYHGPSLSNQSKREIESYIRDHQFKVHFGHRRDVANNAPNTTGLFLYNAMKKTILTAPHNTQRDHNVRDSSRFFPYGYIPKTMVILPDTLKSVTFSKLLESDFTTFVPLPIGGKTKKFIKAMLIF